MLSYLHQLRRLFLLYGLVFFGAFGLSYTYKTTLFAWLVKPLYAQQNSPDRFIFTGLPEAFMTYTKLSAWSALCLTFPLLLMGLGRFLKPALYKQEHRLYILFMISAPLLFYGGAALSYYGVFPLTWSFFLSFQAHITNSLPLSLEARMGEYLSLCTKLMFAFGLAFQLPLIAIILCKAHLLSANALAKGRRYAIVGLFFMAAVLTPPDFISQLMLGCPLVLLYESAIWACWYIERQRSRTDKQGE
jgi:sec-independent protein translocase protein TatC